ncbi:MAG: hypothetical protein ACYC65_07900 [Candidatus Limnocylindrales bacterium]
MKTLIHTTTRITPWDDREFVRMYEQAREAAHQEDLGDGPAAAAEVQRRLREAGYPDARVDVDRTVEEALGRVAHWVVRRDG